MKRSAILLAPLMAGVITAPAKADIVIGPRFSYYFDNTNQRTSNLEGVAESQPILSPDIAEEISDALGEPVMALETPFRSASLADQIGFPMIGAMVNFGNDRDRFTVTGMVGSGTGAAELVRTRTASLVTSIGSIEDLEIQTAVGGSEVDRIDIEATWQRRLNENFAITSGLRYERLDVRDTADFRAVGSDQILVFFRGDPSLPFLSNAGELTLQSDFVAETITARAGATAFVPVNDSTTAFFSGMAQFGYRRNSGGIVTTAFPDRPDLGEFEDAGVSSDEFSIGPDMAVGLQFSFGDNVALDVRYRAVIFFPVSGSFDFTDPRVNHGVNMGLTFRL